MTSLEPCLKIIDQLEIALERKFPLQWYVAESDEPPLKYTLSFPIDFAIHY